MSDRCPSCGASVRTGADWCTLCYADLRPAPPPPPPAPEPVPAPVPEPVSVSAGPDPLSAPYEAILGAQLVGTPLAPATETKIPTWPCTECEAANPIEEMACLTCGSPFGARFATRTDSSARRNRMMKALAGLGAFLAVVALLSYLATPEPPAETPDAPVEVTQ